MTHVQPPLMSYYVCKTPTSQVAYNPQSKTVQLALCKHSWSLPSHTWSCQPTKFTLLQVFVTPQSDNNEFIWSDLYGVYSSCILLLIYSCLYYMMDIYNLLFFRLSSPFLIFQKSRKTLQQNGKLCLSSFFYVFFYFHKASTNQD